MKTTLKNGLQVVLEENHAAPVVAFAAWVGVGSADEPPELAGVAHLFEHMLFKGTGRRGVGQIAREVEAAGGDINAWTSFDETVYHLVLAAPFFDTGLDILADALANPTFNPAELERERKVVLEEIKQGQDSPDRVASQLLFSEAFKVHPYGRPIIGNEASISALTRPQLVDFFRRHYVAGNMTLVVVGDFDAAVALDKIVAAFSGLPPAPARPPRASEPAQVAPRVAVAIRDVREAQLLFSFRTPGITHDDVAALDLLAVVLGQGESSRLNLEIVRSRRLATRAQAYMFTSRDAGLMVVSAALSSGRLDEPARALLDETLRLGREEIAPAELEKARNILESDLVFDKETVQGYARKVGFFSCVAGDAEFEDRYFSRLRRLRPADLRAAAGRYLRASNLTVAALLPKAAQAAQAAQSARKKKEAASSVVAARLEAIAAGAEARADRRLAKTPVPSAVDEVVRTVLPSGLRVLVMRDSTVPVVSVQGIWLGGLRYEDARSNGISNLLAALMVRGTETRTAEQIMTEVEGTAGSLGGFAGRNSFGLRAEFLSRHWDRGFDIFADCIRNPAFAEDEIEQERRVVLDEIRAQQDNLGQAAFRLFHATLWQRHPYRLEVLGTPASVATLGRRKLVEHYRRFYRPGGLTIAVVGDVDAARVIAKIEALFGDAPVGLAAAPVVAQEPARKQPAEVFAALTREQAHVVLGYPGTTLRDPARFPLELLAQILAGQGGRLFVEMREKRALVYRVSAFSQEGIDPGYFAVYLACSPENLEQAKSGIRAELGRLLADGVTAEEVERARKYLIGSHAIGLQRKSAVAAALAFAEAYGEDWRAYRRYAADLGKLTAADVTRAARRYLDPRKEVVAAIRPPADVALLTRPATRRAAGPRAAARATSEVVPAQQGNAAAAGERVTEVGRPPAP